MNNTSQIYFPAADVHKKQQTLTNQSEWSQTLHLCKICCCRHILLCLDKLRPISAQSPLGIQLFRYGIAGFLHWGFNFYFSRLSRKPVDPFQVVDADYGFPDGDSFIVYPGPECEPLDSIRNELMREALQDQRALELLARLTSREEACAVLDRACGGTLTSRNSPAPNPLFAPSAPPSTTPSGTR